MEPANKLVDKFFRKFEEFQPAKQLWDDTALLCTLKIHEVFPVIRYPVSILLSTNDNIEEAFKRDPDWLDNFLQRSISGNDTLNKLLLLVVSGGSNQRIEGLIRNQVLGMTAPIIPANAFFVASASAKEALLNAIGRHVPTRYFSPYRIDQIARPPMFVGRDDLIDAIHSSRGLHIIVGPRRIGKSSLVRFFEQSLGKIERTAAEKQMFKCSYSDISELGDDVKERLWNLILRHFNLERGDFAAGGRILKLIGATRQDDRSTQVNEAQALTNLIALYPDQLTIILDEVDQWIEAEAPHWPTLRRLKSMTDDGKAQVVLVGYESLALAAMSDQFPFWGRGKTHLMRPLNVDDVEGLVTKPMENLGLKFPKKDEIIKLIWHTTSGMPHIIQEICALVIEQAFEQKGERVVTLAMVQSAIGSSRTVEAFRNQITSCPLPLAEAIAGVLSIAHVDPYWMKQGGRIAKAKTAPPLLIKEISERLEEEGFEYVDHDFKRALAYLEIRFILEPEDREKTRWKWTNESAREAMQKKIQGIDFSRWLQATLSKYREGSWRGHYKI